MRHAGLILPLFSARSAGSWGIGELPDIARLSRWMADAALDALMVLPLGTMQAGQASPYSAVSTLAIDPIYISVAALPEFERAGGLAALSVETRRALEGCLFSPTVRYDEVRRVKEEALAAAFRVFLNDEWEQLTPRAAELAAYVARERWWLDDYALFQAIAGSTPDAFWRDWPSGLRDRDPHVLDETRRQLWREVLEQQYWQWIAETQWQAARATAREAGVSLWGDLPFVAGTNSAEVWARAGEFMLDVSVGVPPDAFSATGQDWGLPGYRWDVIAESGYAWIRQRGGRMAALYDGIRVDHAVGLFRTYFRPRHGPACFMPDQELAQQAQGTAVFQILRDHGMRLIAEDLGVVPDFVREALTGQGVPGCKVLRWERHWKIDGHPFVNPSEYIPTSAAMTGTHDTEPLALWWGALPLVDRIATLALPCFEARGMVDAGIPWNGALRDAFLELAYSAGSEELFLPVQDVFGWSDRVNTPGTVGDQNWTWALPWPVDQLPAIPEAVERADALRRLAIAHARAEPRITLEA